MDVGPSWTSDREESRARSEASASEVECHTPERKGKEPGSRRRSFSAGPKSSAQNLLEGKLEPGPCMVLVRPKSLQKADCPPRWVAWLGRVEGVAAEGRAQELLLVSIPRLQRTCAIRTERVHAAPTDSGQGRISKNA